MRSSATSRSGGGILILPTLSILPHSHQPPLRYLTQDEVRRFFAVMADPRDRALFALMYHCLRVGEVLLPRRGDVDLERGRLLVRRLKGGSWSEQISSGAPRGCSAPTSRTPGGPAEPLFAGRLGPLQRRQIQARFVRYRVKAGLPGRLTSHSLRHSIATHLLDAGASLEFVQDHLGHRNIRSTAIYARITDRHREALMRSFERSPWIVQPDSSRPPPPPSRP